MDKRSKATRWAKAVKQQFKELDNSGSKLRVTGALHIKAEAYGKVFDLVPYTNRYVKQVKEDLKREVRAAKRSDKQDVRKEIEEILLEQ